MRNLIILIVSALVLGACMAKSETDESKPEDAPEATTTETDESTDGQPTDEPGNPQPEAQPDAEPEPESFTPSKKAADWKAPNRIKVQHILIGVKESGKGLPRSLPLEEAREKAQDLCRQLRDGADMSKLVAENSSDRGEGIYTMVETGRPDPGRLIFLRSGMVKGFGDTAYQLDVGEVAITDFEPKGNVSPFGFHVIKRLE